MGRGLCPARLHSLSHSTGHTVVTWQGLSGVLSVPGTCPELSNAEGGLCLETHSSPGIWAPGRDSHLGREAHFPWADPPGGDFSAGSCGGSRSCVCEGCLSRAESLGELDNVRWKWVGLAYLSRRFLQILGPHVRLHREPESVQGVRSRACLVFAWSAGRWYPVELPVPDGKGRKRE